MQRSLRFIFAAVTLLAVAVNSFHAGSAQQSAIDTYAITGARIVTVSGANIERGTVVIRDGLIQAVGANVTAPADARVIDGTGLTVYPGLIDAYTSLGIPQPAPQTARTTGAGATSTPTPQAVQ